MSGEQPPTTVGPSTRLDELYRTDHLKMVRLARLMTGSLATAEEVVHDAFVAMIDRVDDVDRPGAYLRMVVVNNCREVFRRSGTERRKLETARSGREQVVLPVELDETWRLLDRLDHRRRVALVLRYYEDLTIAQIAEVMDEPEGTIKSLIHRGLQQLRQEMQQ